jgi:hypothetical protein
VLVSGTGSVVMSGRTRWDVRQKLRVGSRGVLCQIGTAGLCRLDRHGVRKFIFQDAACRNMKQEAKCLCFNRKTQWCEAINGVEKTVNVEVVKEHKVA